MSDHQEHEHRHGFQHDFPNLLGRRRFLSIMGSLGVVTASGLPATAADCIALPWETQGPYPADGSNVKNGQTVNALVQDGILREDIRSSFGTASDTADGVPLSLELTLLDADGCTPLDGHAVYIWHCDAAGKYSLYDFPDSNWLRGLAIADENGKVRFTTIVPGCYPSRWPHIHFEVFKNVDAAVSGENSLLTAQIALPEETCSKVYKLDVYADSTQNLKANTIARDNVFGDNSQEEITQQTLDMNGSVEEGYKGAVSIPIDFDADKSVIMAPPMPSSPGSGMPPPKKP